jgi:hypothetical protein
VSGVPWLIITDSGLDDWIYWYFFTITRAHNQWLLKTRSILLDCDCVLFSCDRLGSDLRIGHFFSFTSWTFNHRTLSSLMNKLVNWTLVSESESYVTTDGQSASLSWNKAPIWGLRPDLRYCQTVAGLLMWRLSLTRGQICRLQLPLALATAVILGSESRGACDHILLPQIRDFPFRRLLRLAGQRCVPLL